MSRLALGAICTALCAAAAASTAASARDADRASAFDRPHRIPDLNSVAMCGRALRPDPEAVVSAYEQSGPNAWPGAMVVGFGVRNDSPCRYENTTGVQRVTVSFSGCRATARLVRPVPDGVIPVEDQHLSLTFNALAPGEEQTRFVTLILADVSANCTVTARIRYSDRAAFDDSRWENDDADRSNNRATAAAP